MPQKIKLLKPIQIFLFLLSCLLLLFILSVFYGGKDISIHPYFSIRIFNLQTYFTQKDELKADTVKEVIQAVELLESQIDSAQIVPAKMISADTLKIYQSLRTPEVDKNFISQIEYPDNNKALLRFFIKAIHQASQKSTHILYYGDSQIEEDRFSGYLRSKLQASYGGSGCGLLNIMPVAQWSYPKVIYSESWYKWDCFADAPKANEYYGIMGQSFLIDFTKGVGKINIKCNSSALPSVCMFNKICVYYGFAKEVCNLKFFNNQELIAEQLLDNPAILDKKILAVKNNENISIEVEGLESPYFYGVSLESFNNGVYVDNIALRGSSGTFFHLIDKQLLKQFFEDLNVCLIILQFGGNVMPMIDSEEKAKQYANYINYQLKTIKSINHQIPILFIGPADMSVNIDGVMQTHPYLPSVIDYLREVVLKNNCAFFDMYKAMGGKNSMPVWVKENLAAKDYIHFSPQGARKMASIIYYSLMRDIQEINP